MKDLKEEKITHEEKVYWLKKEAEERKRDGGLATNFDMEFEQVKLAKNLYPSLGNDPNADGYRSNARKALEEQ